MMIIYESYQSLDGTKIEMRDLLEKQFIDMRGVVLLTASVFPENMTLNTWSYKDGTKRVEGFYQMEPVPRMLAHEGKNIDLVVIMASEAAMDEANVYINGEKKKPISPVCYLINQLRELVAFRDTVFLVVQTENRLTESISEVVEILRKIKHENSKANLYLDTHGGPRNNQEVLNVTDLLI